MRAARIVAQGASSQRRGPLAIGGVNCRTYIKPQMGTIIETIEAAAPLVKTRGVQVNWRDGAATVFNETWLRVNCVKNMHPSGQRLSSPGDLLDVRPAEVRSTRHDVTIKWSDGHESIYRSDWLRSHDGSVSTIIGKIQSSWPKALRSWEAIPKVELGDMMKSDAAVHKLLRYINNSGLCIVDNSTGAPEATVTEMTERIAPVSHGMLYGNSFDVLSQDHARNLAYTRERLRLHQDLVYYESPPGLQLLQCIKFDTSIKGGESFFLDAFEAAKRFRKLHPKAFNVLSKIPATFQKVRVEAHVPSEQDLGEVEAGEGEANRIPHPPHINDAALSACHFTYRRPHIELDPGGEIIAVYWAPMFEGTLQVQTQDVDGYYEAYNMFQAFIEDSDFAKEHTIRFELRPGQTVVFSNRRMLHGREGYSGEGLRHLQGAYTNIDETLSRYLVLHEKHTKDIEAAQEGEEESPALGDGHCTRWGNGQLPM